MKRDNAAEGMRVSFGDGSREKEDALNRGLRVFVGVYGIMSLQIVVMTLPRKLRGEREREKETEKEKGFSVRRRFF